MRIMSELLVFEMKSIRETNSIMARASSGFFFDGSIRNGLRQERSYSASPEAGH